MEARGERGGRRLVGHLLQYVGIGTVIAGFIYGVGSGSPAYAKMMTPISRAITSLASIVANVPVSSVTATPSPSPGPSSSPLPTPSPRAYTVKRGGPLRFGFSGSLSFGAHAVAATQFNGRALGSPLPSASPSQFIGAAISTNRSQAQESVGMQAEVTRRTGSTMMDLKMPIGFGSQGTQFGLFQAIFSTPHYALGYGSQVLTLFGQIPAGGTQRGIFFIVPTRDGDATFYEGPTIGALSEVVPLYGVRYRRLSAGALYEAGFAAANGPLTGKALTAILGAAASRGALTLTGEAAFQRRMGGDVGGLQFGSDGKIIVPTSGPNATSGLTYQLRADQGGTATYYSAIVRHVSNGFVAFGNGEIYGDDYVDFGFHKSSGLQTLSFDTSRERVGNPAGAGSSTNRLTSLSYGGPLRFGNYTLSLQSQNTSGTDVAAQWVGTANVQVSATVGHGFLLLGSQFSRTTQGDLGGLEGTQAPGSGGNVSNVGYNASLQQPLGAVTAGLSFQSYKQNSQAFGTTQLSSIGVNLTRTWGRTSIGFLDTISHTISALSNSVQTNPQIQITRQISPAISLQTGIGYQTLADKLNPAANGRSRTFTFQVNAPFSYGSGIVTGRTDPRLPATIIGKVLTDSQGVGTYSAASNAGENNVLVVLDDKVVQRTDLTGGFQFSFVTPGQHQLRIESSSLPRGVTVDQPIYTLQVQGGQTAQVLFQVGDFGGVNGHVYGRNDAGIVVPLPNVLLRVDGGAYSQTDATGAYGFGRLKPGKHTVSIVPQSVPAFASFDAAAESVPIQVKNGVYTPLDFNAQPLGSISGTIIFDKELSPDYVGPVPNAYVVAEPGEHAAIDNDDGSFIIDNLPPGDYTVSVDPETLPDQTGASPDSAAVTLGSQEHYQGLAFVVGHEKKKVVFTLLSGGSAAPSAPTVHLSEPRLPPYGMAGVLVNAPKSAGRVALEAFGSHTELAYDESRKGWVGNVTVPASEKSGRYSVSANVEHGTQPEAATLVVDTKLPIAIVQMDPPNASAGTYVHIRARFLVDVRPGDRINWQDGTYTILSKPVTGRVFTFSLRISLRPLHGVLLTKVAHLPISVM